MKRNCWGNEMDCWQNCAGRTSAIDPTGQLAKRPSILSVQQPASRRNEEYNSCSTHRDDNTLSMVGDDGSQLLQQILPEDVIAKEMKKLSVKERDIVFEDVHGAKQQVQESEYFIDKSLAKLEKELNKMPKLHNAYSRALFLNRRYVKDRRFELMFLHADEFDPKKAAKRMLYHFEKKLELFGHDMLTKHIRYSDLDEDTVAVLRRAPTCLFPNVHDNVGRNLHTMAFKTKIENPTSKAYSRVGWFKYMTTLLQDERCQKNGIVTIFHTHGASIQNVINRFKFVEANLWVSRAVPIRLIAIHICMDTKIFRPLITHAMQFSGSNRMKLRTKLHYGSMMECQYQLNSFGIPATSLQLDVDGNRRHDIIQKLLDEMIAQDQSDEQAEAANTKNWIVRVREVDVLLGKGPHCQWFPGTVALMDVIKKLKPQHNFGNRKSKKEISTKVMKIIQTNGGRFLEQDTETGWWVEVGDHQARLKVASGFRNLNKNWKPSDESSDTTTSATF